MCRTSGYQERTFFDPQLPSEGEYIAGRALEDGRACRIDIHEWQRRSKHFGGDTITSVPRMFLNAEKHYEKMLEADILRKHPSAKKDTELFNILRHIAEQTVSIKTTWAVPDIPVWYKRQPAKR